MRDDDLPEDEAIDAEESEENQEGLCLQCFKECKPNEQFCSEACKEQYDEDLDFDGDEFEDDFEDEDEEEFDEEDEEDPGEE
jgi:hypothetical protein